jgi:hypothetical protein
VTLVLAAGYPLLIAGFLWFLRDLLSRHDAERAKLLNRIQKPELAVAQSLEPPSLEPPFVPFDDDEAYHAYRESREAHS